ncbi:MAG: Unknown protein [uncultured Sulfurovum sp.]|uniref:Uncharacterized protein n=1 Tax=uncultured Sulfurovum sp. TaxID=269237 RepID=A0A6S6UHL7_9BACT|nr:MAG: Unknown protein [uncultured Sulfurovum sp.]
MRRNRELLLVHTAMNRVILDNPVNVMVTPQFYTLKKEPLPVKYAYQAKKIAPSLFEGLLEEGEHEYSVFQENDMWVFVAYNMEKILDFLASKGVESDNVGKLYFAQQALDSFTRPMSLNESEALVVMDEVLVVVPTMVLGEDEFPTSYFDNQFTPKQGVTVKSNKNPTESMVGDQQSWLLAGVFVLFAGMFFVEASRYQGGDASANEELETLYEAYPELASSYTRDDISQKYRTIDVNERKKREAIKSIGSMIFKGSTLTSLTVNEKGFTALFEYSNNDTSSRLKVLAKKKNFKVSEAKNSTLRMEGTL